MKKTYSIIDNEGNVWAHNIDYAKALDSLKHHNEALGEERAKDLELEIIGD